MQLKFTLTREAGLRRLATFATHAGQAYSSGRNTDHGASEQTATSALSPYLRRRLLTEQEVVAAAVEERGSEAGKFVQEVFWRTYFKGYLETRPDVWTNYQDQLAHDRQRLASESGLRKAYEAAIAGSTGIDGFDDWAHELVEAHWLHNHARMWFASIWIFSLGLPWALGADFFLQHLLDGDPASNTLSWRWVAGLHTKGKAYAARAENIRRYTDGRYDPHGLNESPEPLNEDVVAPVIKVPPQDPLPSGDVALLLHVEDLNPESLYLRGMTVRRIAGMVAHVDGADETVQRADNEALQDAILRAKAHFDCSVEPFEDGWAASLPIVTPYAPRGPSHALLPQAVRIRREWDQLSWPQCTRGFFQLKNTIPTLLREVGLPPL